MFRVPRFQQRERLFTANLADDDPVWSESHSRAYEPSHICGVGGMQLESVARGALQLQRVLDDDEALGLVAQTDHLVNECVTSVVFPEPVPPAITMFRRLAIASRNAIAWPRVTML